MVRYIFGLLTVLLIWTSSALADVDICATASCSGKTTTGTISASSIALTVANAIDFTNGQGIRVNHAGLAISVGAPSGLGVSVVGTTGSTAYLYKVSAIDAHGGVSAATASGGPSNGNAELTPNNYNDISWLAGSGSPPAYAVWRSVNGGAYTYLKMVNYTEFWDYGITDAKPSWVPATPPVSDLPDWLVTSVLSGGGTTSLTLNLIATSAVTNEIVTHDDTAILGGLVTALHNAGGGYDLTCPGSARIRYTSSLGNIDVGDSFVIGTPGCTFLPAGVFLGLVISGPSLGTSCTLASDLTEGSIRVPLTDASAFSPGDFVVVQQTAPNNTNSTNLFYFHASPIRSIVGNTLTITDPSPTSFAPTFTTLTFGGTWVNNDTVTVNISGHTSVTATISSTFGFTPTLVAQQVSVAINNAYSDGITAFNEGGPADPTATANIYVPSAFGATVSFSKVSSGGTVSLIAHDGSTAATCNKWNPIYRVGFRDITLDGTDSILTGLYLNSVADWEAKGVRTRNIHAGGALYRTVTYSGIVDDVADVSSGSAAANFQSYATIWGTQFTLEQQSNIRSRDPKSFGVQNQAGGWLQATNIYSSGAEAGRGYKLEGLGAFSIGNIAANNASFTNFASAYGNHRGSIFGLFSYGGERSLDGNGECIWNADTYDTLQRYFGVHTAGCHTSDMTFYVSDVKNSVTGAVVNGETTALGLGGIYNYGLTRFRDTNGYDRVGGKDGQWYSNNTPVTPAAPTVIYTLDR